MPKAARLGDPIGHSPGMNWLVKGLLIGAAIAVAGVAIVGTGGLAAAAIIGAAAAGGAGIGELMSTMSWAPKEIAGAILGACSTNVFTNNRPAARAHPDRVACGKHPATPPIATGSGNVYINSQPAARDGDKTGCGGNITDGSANVFIGGGTQQTDPIHPEDLVPGWVHAALFVVGAAAAVVLAGPIVATVGLVGSLAGGAGGAWIGGKVWGEGSDGQKWAMLGGSVIGGALGAKGGAWVADRMAAPPPIAVKNTVPQGARGPISGRPFDPERSGGPIRNLSSERIKISHKGIDVVEKHVSRFGDDPYNNSQVARLRAIADGHIKPTVQDRNFYAHELREYVRYRRLGYESGMPDDPDLAHTLWNNAHTATLEDYGLKEGPGVLYHPDNDPWQP